MDASAVIDVVRRAAPGAVLEAVASVDMPTIYVDREHLVEVSRVLRDDPDLQFVFLADVTAVDYLPAEPRFETVYHMACLGDAYKTTSGVVSASLSNSRTPGVVSSPKRLCVKVRVPGADPRVPSVVSVWPTAGWPEREVYDLMGVTFDGHPDLRRILTPDDWEGHPLRKDYPVQIRKDTAGWSPLQVTAEEFAANIRASRDAAAKRSGGRRD
jgi:NADH-quinone oxidoreductase subunit C